MALVRPTGPPEAVDRSGWTLSVHEWIAANVHTRDALATLTPAGLWPHASNFLDQPAADLDDLAENINVCGCVTAALNHWRRANGLGDAPQGRDDCQ